MPWSEKHINAMDTFLSAPSHLKDALTIFIAAMKQDAQEQCASHMARVPRDFERASDYAAKADAYSLFMTDLEAEAKKAFLGPTGK